MGTIPPRFEAALAGGESGNKRDPRWCAVKTVIGKGSPNKQGTESCHGAALGEDEIALTREKRLAGPMRLLKYPDDIRCGMGSEGQRVRVSRKPDWQAGV